MVSYGHVGDGYKALHDALVAFKAKGEALKEVMDTHPTLAAYLTYNEDSNIMAAQTQHHAGEWSMELPIKVVGLKDHSVG